MLADDAPAIMRQCSLIGVERKTRYRNAPVTNAAQHESAINPTGYLVGLRELSERRPAQAVVLKRDAPYLLWAMNNCRTPPKAKVNRPDSHRRTRRRKACEQFHVLPRVEIGTCFDLFPARGSKNTFVRIRCDGASRYTGQLAQLASRE